MEERDYKNRSVYFYEPIQEVRIYREQGFLTHHESEERTEELKQEVEHLENRLENQEQQSSDQIKIDDIDFLERFLEETCKLFDRILREIIESGTLDDLIHKRVEDQPYSLAQQDRIEFERGHGWKLKNKGDW